MDWNCYSRMKAIFAAHPEYLAAKAVQDTLRYSDSDPAYSMCESYGVTDEASLINFIGSSENLGIYSLSASEVTGGIAVDVGLRGSGTLRIYVNDVLKDTHVTVTGDLSYNTIIPLGAGTYSVKAVGTGSSQIISVTVAGTVDGALPPAEQKYKLVFQFSGALSTTLSGAAIEILHIMSDIIARMTGGYVGTPYYEGSDKMVFMVGTMGAGGIEGFIASSPKLISLAKWFAGLFGLVLVSSYITEVITGVINTVNIAQTDAIVDKCLSSNLTDEAKAECVKRALNLSKPTDWGTIVMMLGGLAIAAYFLKDVIGGKK